MEKEKPGKPAKRPSPYGPVKFKTVAEYHRSVPQAVRGRLKELHAIIKAAAPGAEEIISYNMPAFRKYRNLVYYAAHKEHIGLYPSSAPLTVFANELEKFRTSKGAIQFPYDKPLPKSLITKIVKFLVREDNLKASK